MILKKITQQKNWKTKIRIILLIPLSIILLFIISQSFNTNLNGSAITGNMLSNTNNKYNNYFEQNISSIINKNNLIDKLFSFDFKNTNINNTKKGKKINQINNTKNDSIIYLDKNSKSKTKPPKENIENTTNDTTNKTNDVMISDGVLPTYPANFWGVLYTNNEPVNAGKILTVKINNTEQTVTTITGGYYTVTIPVIDNEIFFIYNEQKINYTNIQAGNIKELNLYFN